MWEQSVIKDAGGCSSLLLSQLRLVHQPIVVVVLLHTSEMITLVIWKRCGKWGQGKAVSGIWVFVSVFVIVIVINSCCIWVSCVLHDTVGFLPQLFAKRRKWLSSLLSRFLLCLSLSLSALKCGYPGESEFVWVFRRTCNFCAALRFGQRFSAPAISVDKSSLRCTDLQFLTFVVVAVVISSRAVTLVEPSLCTCEWKSDSSIYVCMYIHT